MLVLTASVIDDIVDTLSPDDLLDLTRRVFLPSSTPESTPPQCPPRITLPVPEYTALVMPAYLPPFGSAVKVVSVPKPSTHAGSSPGLPATTVLLAPSGAALAVLNARRLTALRNAAASLLSARILIPSTSVPRVLICFGRGEQIKAHVKLFLKAYPSLKEILVVVREVEGSGEENMEGIPIRTTAQLTEEELGRADIIICATPSREPLFDISRPSHHVHIVLIGSYMPQMHEVPTSLIHRARFVLLDDKAACLREAGELIDAGLNGTEDGVYGMEQVLDRPTLVSGLDGPSSDGKESLTIFKSVGTGLQDVAIASLVYRRAVEMAVGVDVPEWE